MQRLRRPQSVADVPDGLLSLFGRLVKHRMLKWASETSDYSHDVREDASYYMDADVVSSLLVTARDEAKAAQAQAESEIDSKSLFQTLPDPQEHYRHALLLDLDLPTYLVASTQPDHYHLYVDVPGGIPHGTYVKLLKVLAEAGVIEKGYAKASLQRGFTSLRMPWKTKDLSKKKTAPATASFHDLLADVDDTEDEEW